MSYAYWEQSQSPSPEPAMQEPPQSPTGPQTGTPRQRRNLEPVQIFAGVVGATFLLVGILGFIPGITSMYDELELAGRDSHAELLGLFQVSVLHNIVHMLFGVGLLAARKASTSVQYLIVGGIAYLGVVLYGAVVDHGSEANFLPINTADNILHLVLGLGMIALGVLGAALLRRNQTARTA